jgi:hypothetical protein
VQWEERVRCLWFHACSCDQRECAEFALVRAADGPVKKRGKTERQGVEAKILKSPIILTFCSKYTGH